MGTGNESNTKQEIKIVKDMEEEIKDLKEELKFYSDKVWKIECGIFRERIMVNLGIITNIFFKLLT